ncbi:hypothetical protein GBW32_21250 [Streptomyces tsukubensis]|uniref:Uncharacterized protein n=1 Tax=Streptomyces tsukubensis TaxID=83656 RepID=A0A1V4A069_9ACTN|nr:hypothetical protein B1H18_32905 [Streptomyces tsukubensis]QFR95087.1 hypothetical protein GBW32_21250 [Streptomyces tsukubensis]
MLYLLPNLTGRSPPGRAPTGCPGRGFESPVRPATPGTAPRRVVGIAHVHPVRGRPSALRCTAPDAAGPALRADDATFETRPSAEPQRAPTPAGHPPPPSGIPPAATTVRDSARPTNARDPARPRRTPCRRARSRTPGPAG